MMQNSLIGLGGYNPSKGYELARGCKVREKGILRKRTEIDCPSKFDIEKEAAEFCEENPEHPFCEYEQRFP